MSRLALNMQKGGKTNIFALKLKPRPQDEGFGSMGSRPRLQQSTSEDMQGRLAIAK